MFKPFSLGLLTSNSFSYTTAIENTGFFEGFLAFDRCSTRPGKYINTCYNGYAKGMRDGFLRRSWLSIYFGFLNIIMCIGFGPLPRELLIQPSSD